jgi:serine/threonine protein kinase
MDIITVNDKIITFINYRYIGRGAFGMVYKANISETGEIVAIKKCEEDPKYINRELGILSRLNHQNIIKLKYNFNTQEYDKTYVNLVLEYIPYNLFEIIKKYDDDPIPSIIVKLYMYQLCRAVAYLHSLDIAHRDIKPQNILVDPDTEVLKLCDFGSAKTIKSNEESVSYICSRYYRAPELILGATTYTKSVDIWSIGCVFAEILLMLPIFKTNKNNYMFEEFIKILGKPTSHEIISMNAKSMYDKSFNNIEQKYTLQYLFSDPDIVDLMTKMLRYNPNERISCIEALNHSFFNDLKTTGLLLPNGKEAPPLFNFSLDEYIITLNIDFVKSLNEKLYLI